MGGVGRNERAGWLASCRCWCGREWRGAWSCATPPFAPCTPAWKCRCVLKCEGGDGLGRVCLAGVLVAVRVRSWRSLPGALSWMMVLGEGRGHFV